MDWVFVITAAAGAFALPAWFVLGWLDSPSRRPWVRPARWGGASLALVWLVNLGSLAWGGGWSPPLWFVAMSLGFLGSAGAGWGALGVASGLTGHRAGQASAVAFVAVIVVLWLIGVYRTFLLGPSGGEPDFRFGEVFTMGTLAGSGGGLAAAVLLVSRRRVLVPGVRRALAPVLVPLAALIFGAVAADGFAVDQALLGRDLPMSPFFLVWTSALVYGAAGVWWHKLVPVEGPADFGSWVRSRGISDREREVLELLADGRSRTEVADTLFISPVTVKNHLAALYRKTGTSDLGALTALARITRG